jgi:hypothetical protein
MYFNSLIFISAWDPISIEAQYCWFLRLSFEGLMMAVLPKLVAKSSK